MENIYGLVPGISAEDPNEIEYYIKRLMDCSDVLIAIRERKDCFLNAKYEARNKDMLVIYMMLDCIQELVTEIRADNTSFKSTTEDGRRAIFEVLPEYAISELLEKIYNRGH